MNHSYGSAAPQEYHPAPSPSRPRTAALQPGRRSQCTSARGVPSSPDENLFLLQDELGLDRFQTNSHRVLTTQPVSEFPAFPRGLHKISALFPPDLQASQVGRGQSQQKASSRITF